MYCKYNTVLRDIGHLRSEQLREDKRKGSIQSAHEMSLDLQRYQRTEADKPREQRMGGQAGGFPGHTFGNLYTTCAAAPRTGVAW